MGRVRSQGVATGAKAAQKRSELGSQNREKLRAFGRLTRLAVRLRTLEAERAVLTGVLDAIRAVLSESPRANELDPLTRIRRLLDSVAPSTAPSTTGVTAAGSP
jgi:hypothetical protein